MEFDVKMNAKVLYRYLSYQALTNYTTWVSLFLCAMTVVLFFYTRNSLALLAGFIVFVNISWPWNLYLRTKRQMLTNNSFKKPIHYRVDSEGITISQDEEALCMPWDMLFKVVVTKRSVLVYTAPNNAWIFPDEQLGEQKEELLALLKEYMPERRLKMR
jgi:hypothetical protein